MPQPRRLYLHVGLQKTGTSYLQGIVRRNARELADQGLDLVPRTRRDAFELMLQVRGRYNPERDAPSAARALDRFAATLARSRGSRALLSQESLAAARPGQIRRLLEACGDHEPHVVLTVRDLARQLPSSWQQELKAAKVDDYQAFLRQLRSAQRAGRTGHPWIQLDAPTVLARWAKHVPVDRMHVVTVPPAGSSPTLLLERFCRVLDVDPGALRPLDTASNTSLGRVQAEVLRRVNAELPDDLRRRQIYGEIGKGFLASRVLARQDTRRILVPEEFREWCVSVADAQVEALAAAGYDVVGTLEDLRCRDTAFTESDAYPTEDEVAAAAVRALAQILTLRAENLQRHRSPGAGPRRWRARVRGLIGGRPGH